MTSVLEPADTVAEVEQARDVLRDRARESLGVSAEVDERSLREVLREKNVTLYPVLALGVLNIVDLFQSNAFTVLAPNMSRGLGLSLATIGLLRTLSFVASVLAPLPIARLVQGRPRRALLCLVTAFAWSVVTLWTGFVPSAVALGLLLALDGLTTGSVQALHQPLLIDSYPPQARVRILSVYSGFGTSAAIFSPLLVGLFATILDLTWRGVFIGMGATSILASLVALRLRDPGFGRFDTDEVKATVVQTEVDPTATTDDVHEDDVELGFFEILRRILLIPAVRRIVSGYLILGVMLVPFNTFVSFFLEEKWGLGPGSRGVFYAVVNGAAVLALIAYGNRAEKAFRRDPGSVMTLAGWGLLGGVVCIALSALSPWFLAMVLGFVVGQCLIVTISPGLSIASLSVVEAHWRPHLAAVIGIFQAAGAIGGLFFLSGIEQRFGISGAMVALLIPAGISAFVLRSAAPLVIKDLDRMIDQLIEAEESEQITARGERLPMLACRCLDFSYDQLQVLFDVDFTVDDGELVALLGVNGAGKSTLLKVVSGIGLPSRGSVRFRGQDITYLDAERRLKLGITQIPGGRAVFGPMTVVENLRLFGYSLGRDKKVVDEAIERCLTAFPRLDERKTSNAATLSGGEQQMLGLSKALMLRPRLLLIDELSLGLAPIIVAQLLDMVRRINADGTAVVLVEQSVNVALSVAEHAYFMEKGEIRFDGSASELLGRGDLLRAVFLEGVGKGAEA
jgi:ABC-type branched-subunit amino acid transport system ATPase component/MFS family permease